MKKIVTYLAAIGMILSMIPASVSAADTAPVSAAVQAEEERHSVFGKLIEKKNAKKIKAFSDEISK